MTIPLRNRAAEADYARDRLVLRQQEIRAEQIEKQIGVEIDALVALDQARASVDASRQERMYREQALAAEIDRLTVGASTTYLVIQYQGNLAHARSAEIAALAGLVKAQAAVARARGQLLERYGISAPMKLTPWLLAFALTGPVTATPGPEGLSKTPPSLAEFDAAVAGSRRVMRDYCAVTQEITAPGTADPARQAKALAALRDARARWSSVQNQYAVRPPAEYARDKGFAGRLQDIADAFDDMKRSLSGAQPRRSFRACGNACGLFVALHEDTGWPTRRTASRSNPAPTRRRSQMPAGRIGTSQERSDS